MQMIHIHKMQRNPTLNIELEIIYSLVVLIICALIFIRTKQIHELTGHKGIMHFRQTFIYLAIAYLMRFLAQFFRLSDIGLDTTRILILIGYFIFIYASSMAILHLSYSAGWKKLQSTLLGKEYVLHIIAILLTLFVLVTASTTLFILTQAALFIYAVAISFKTTKAKKSMFNFRAVYILLFLFWLLNLFVASIPLRLMNTRLTLYILSSIILGTILYRVLQRTGGKNWEKKEKG